MTTRTVASQTPPPGTPGPSTPPPGPTHPTPTHPPTKAVSAAVSIADVADLGSQVTLHSIRQATAHNQARAATAVEEHYEVGGWKQDGRGGCGVECVCGVVFDGFDSLAEAAVLLAHHIERQAARVTRRTLGAIRTAIALGEGSDFPAADTLAAVKRLLAAHAPDPAPDAVRTVTHTWRTCRGCGGPVRRVQADDDVRYEHVLPELTAHRAVPR